MGERIRTLVGAAVLLAMADAHALSLGAARGEAVVGQPLELAFDLALDPGGEAGTSCVAAEVFYGDTRVDASRVRVVTRPGSQPLQGTVQVSSNVSVNEPVVSVLLKAGCSPAISRRFVLLSSSPVESAVASAAGVTSLNSGSVRTQPQVPMAVPTPVPTPVQMPAVVVAPRSAIAAAVVRSETPAVRANTRETATAPVKTLAPRRSASPVAAATTAPAAAKSGARLELQSPVDWLQEQVLPLRSSVTMATPSLTATAEQRAAAAALWRELGGAEGAPTVDADSQQRIQALESQIKMLQNGVRQGRGREADLQSQLAEAKSSGDVVWLAIWSALGLLVTGGLVGSLLILRRKGGSGLRWRKAAEPSVFGSDAVTAFGEGFVDTQPAPVDFLYPTAEPSVAAFPVQPTASADATGATKIPHRFSDTAPNSRQNGDSAFGASRIPPDESSAPAAPTSAEAAMRAARELRNGSANDLADVQQNADFFASLGQYEQAIELLQEYIASNPGTSPIAYLDLLKLFHTLSETEPYRKLRTDFNAAFNADVPPFAAFLKGSKDLGAYNDVLQRISDAWSQASVLDLIESLLVRHSGEGAHPPFQLEAYRDLLLLYEIAKIEHNEDSGVKLAVPPSLVPAHTANSPMVATVSPVAAPAAPVDFKPSIQPDVSLDLPSDTPEPGYPMLPTSSTTVSEFGADNLGIPLEFGSSSFQSELPRVSLEGMAAPETERFSRNQEPPAADPHLIDFDMFDVEMPPLPSEHQPKR